jgi:hypothetical protein
MTDFFKKIKRENQQFKCYKSGDGKEELKLVVPIHHNLNAPAGGQEIDILKKIVPVDNDQLIEFYKRCNGVKLYCNSDITGIEICPIDKLDELNAEWKESFSDFEEDELYEFQKGGIAFGTISMSGNYFVVYKGSVYYSDHDGGDDTVIGEDVNEFLNKTVDEPADFLYDMGCYTRYSDGKTSGQWIPKEFTADEV